MVASSEDASKALLPYIQLFQHAILQANEEQKTALTPQARAKMPKRAISTIMNALVSHQIRANLTGLPGVEIKERYAQTQVIFSSAFLMKCKQSRRRRISFIPTQLMLDFMNQLQIMFPGMPSPVTNIILTYQWNEARTEIVKIFILCPANGNDSYYWIKDISLAAPPHVIPTAPPQTPPQLPIERKRIVPKAKREGNRREPRSQRKD